MDCSMPGFLVLHHLLELAQIHVHWVGDAIQPSHPLSSPSPAFNLSSIKVVSNESALHIRWPKYWSFSFSISSCTEYSGLISSRIDWFDLLAIQGTLKSLLQHHSSKVSILQRAAFLTVQLSHLTLYFTKQNKQTKKTTRLLQWSQSECYGGLCWAQIWVWGTGEISCPKQMRMKWVSWENPPLRKGDLGLTSDTWQHYKKVHFWIQLFS